MSNVIQFPGTGDKERPAQLVIIDDAIDYILEEAGEDSAMALVAFGMHLAESGIKYREVFPEEGDYDG